MRWNKPKLQPLPSSVAEAVARRMFQTRREASAPSSPHPTRRGWGPFLALTWLRAKRHANKFRTMAN